MKKLYYLLILLSQFITAQVGINTTDPKAQLEIKSSNQLTPSNTDGLLIPKIDAFPAINPTAAQQGMMVYLTTLSGVDSPGFYYWDNPTTTWLPLKGNNGVTLDQAYDFGGAGLGKTITADAGAVLINGTDGLVSTGTLGNGAIAPSGSGTKMFWNPRKSAFRAGQIDSGLTMWDDVNIGERSAAFGGNTTASGNYSVAFGAGTVASGIICTSFGSGTTASGNVATAFGVNATASGSNSTAFGQTTVASGFLSTAFGQNTTAGGSNSTVFGCNSAAPSFGETVFGIGATNYTPSTNGAGQFRPANSNDRLFVVGNALDLNSNAVVDAIERSDAMVILKNGSTGIGTSLPDALLDVNATDNGILIPRVALTSVLIQAPIVNPRGGTLPTSTLIYNTATAGVSPNNVFPGFYYWNGTRWNRFDTNGENNPAYYTAVGTTNTFSTTAFTSIAQMSITFTPKDDIALVNFSAAGHRTDDSCDNGAIFFQILLNGIPVTGWQTAANEGVVNYGGFGNDDIVTWDTNITYPVTVPIGISQTIQIQWYTPDCTMFNNVASPFTGFGNVFKSYRTLTVIDPNGGGGITGTVPVTTNLWAHNGNSGTNPATNFVGTTDAQSLVLKSNNVEGIRIATNGNVGLGTTVPLDKLHVTGSIRMVDGNQGAGKVLTSDANGTGSWQNPAVTDWGLTGNMGTNDPAAPVTYGTSTIAAGENWNGTTDANDYVIGTNSIERFRIKQTTGFVGIGTSVPSRPLHLFTGASGGTPNANADFVLEANGSVYQHFLAPTASETGLLFGSNSSSIRGGVLYSNAGDMLQFRAGGNTNRMLITTDGDVGIGMTPGMQFELSLNEGRKPISNTWSIPSDARLKNVDGKYEKGLTEISKLEPLRFHYKNTEKKTFDPQVLNQEAYGFLAQEVQLVFPEAVAMDTDGYLTFDLHPILIASINAMKELDEKNTALHSENEELKRKLKQHDEQIAAILAELEKRK